MRRTLTPIGLKSPLGIGVALVAGRALALVPDNVDTVLLSVLVTAPSISSPRSTNDLLDCVCLARIEPCASR